MFRTEDIPGYVKEMKKEKLALDELRKDKYNLCRLVRDKSLRLPLMIAMILPITYQCTGVVAVSSAITFITIIPLLKRMSSLRYKPYLLRNSKGRRHFGDSRNTQLYWVIDYFKKIQFWLLPEM